MNFNTFFRQRAYKKLVMIFLLGSSVLVNGCTEPSAPPSKPIPANTPAAIPNINFTLVNSLPHDTNAFTEGLMFYKGELFESTGATAELPQTRSLFGIVNQKTGKINTKAELDRNLYFGEGIAFLDEKIYQLTYRSKVGFIYDARTYKKLGNFTFPSPEGWGLTTDGKYLVMSDGTNVLTYLDPANLQVIKTLKVTEIGYASDHLNELEFIRGYIYANIWTTNFIVKIDPQNGAVVGKLDLGSLAADAKKIFPRSLEMNGIAYDPATDKVLVTGKMWPRIYEIDLAD